LQERWSVVVAIGVAAADPTGDLTELDQPRPHDVAADPEQPARRASVLTDELACAGN
jgi:hypothetical protein